MMKHTLHPGTEQAMGQILGGPAAPDKPFAAGKTHGDVFNMARTILHDSHQENNQRELLGVFTEDRAAIAAAILAAMAGGPILVFPHEISDTALMDLKNTAGLARVIADPKRMLPDTISRISTDPAQGSRANTPLKPFHDINAPLLKLHTGGSTGTPSIWTKTAENIMVEAGFHVGIHKITSDDVFVATVPPYHIYGLLFSVVVPLLAGAAVVNQTYGFPHEIINAVDHNDATILISVPAHYRALKGHNFPSHRLRLAFSSAGTLDPEDEAAFRAETGTQVMEIYGSTETGGIAFRCRAREESFFSPFDRIETRIVNNELKIRSPFISPEISTDDQGFYLAPDRVERCRNRGFSILGRSDTIVKIAGSRVDLDHVKAVLKQMPGIRDAVVHATHTTTGREFDIFALIEGDCDGSHVREFLSENIEAIAHPRRFRIIEKMPMTRAGKYDRSAIEALFTQNNGNFE